MRSERARVRGGLLLVITAMVLAGGAVGATSAAATAPRATASAPLASQTQGFFTAVSCATATNCMAVGYQNTPAPDLGPRLPLAESWNGTSWTVLSTPVPAGAVTASFFAVNCASVVSCVAVGWYNDGTADNYVSLAESWNGSSWTIHATNVPGSAASQLDGVKCSLTTSCIAVGWYSTGDFDLPLSDYWNGTEWAVRAAPLPSGWRGAVLNAVSCISTTTCMTVGDKNVTGTGAGALTESWNGSAWTIRSTHNPSGAKGVSLVGVKCNGVNCMAVGDDSKGVFGETWNGVTWIVHDAPEPTGSASTSFGGVSCSAAIDCTVVGDWAKSDGQNLTLAETWNGARWTIRSTPSPGGLSLLLGVSCSTSVACMAVGEQVDSVGNYLPLAELWNGTSWKVTPS